MGRPGLASLFVQIPLSNYQLLITLPRLIVDYVSQCDHCSTASLVHEIELYNQWLYVKEKDILLSEQKQPT